MSPATRGRVLITGCASGIGLDAARTLAARGWTVYATCRKPEDCARLREEGLDSFPLDYASTESIAAAIDEVTARGGLDALFNNGAFALPGALEDIPRDGLREIFETNLFGWHDLTRQVIPLFRAQGHGRIVNCSSVLGFVPARWRGPYVATKFALEGLTDVLRLELADTPIRVVLLQPGPTTSRFRVNARAPFERWVDWESSALAVRYRSELLARLYAPERPDRFELPASSVTAKLIHALESPRPRRRYKSTLPTYAAAVLRRAAPRALLDRVCRRS